MSSRSDKHCLNQYQDSEPGTGDILRFKIIAGYCDGDVLDVGCGLGVLRSYLPQTNIKSYLGLDTAGRVSVYGSIYNLPFKGDSFDTIVTSEVLEHLEHPVDALRELARVSKNQVIITVPNPWNINQILSLLIHNHNLIEPNHITLFGDNEIERLCKRANLNITIKERSHLPIMRTKRYIPIKSRFGAWNIYVCKKIPNGYDVM